MPYSVKKGFVTIRHNQVRNITTTQLNETCNDVQIELQSQSLSGEHSDVKTELGVLIRFELGILIIY